MNLVKNNDVIVGVKKNTPKGAPAGEGFVPTKGGDGGVAPKKAKKVPRSAHWDDNGKVVLTGSSIKNKADRAAFMDSCIPTTDLRDRAHRRRRLVFEGMPKELDDSWVLMSWGEICIPGIELPGQPRRYHPSQCVGTGDRIVGIDSMFDGAAETAMRLENAGIEMGWHTTKPGQYSRSEMERASVFAGMSRDYVRNSLEGQTSQEAITREDIEG